VKVAAVQHDIAWEDGPATQARLEPMIAQAAAGGARLIVLSEMYATGFSMNPDTIAEEPGGPNERFLIEQAARHGAWLIGSVAQWSQRAEHAGAEHAGAEHAELVEHQPAARLAANVAIVAGPSGQLFRYDKIHPFSYAGEHEHYRAGTDFLTVEIDELRVSVFICYDLRFADEFWALAEDTDLYVVPANWPEQRREHWRALLRARAIENQAYVLGCNRVGDVEQLSHSGDSTIIDPLGRTLAEASYVEAVLIAEVEPAEVQRVRKRFPFLADRR
jgi:predicted amidohydrolase